MSVSSYIFAHTASWTALAALPHLPTTHRLGHNWVAQTSERWRTLRPGHVLPMALGCNSICRRWCRNPPPQLRLHLLHDPHAETRQSIESISCPQYIRAQRGGGGGNLNFTPKASAPVPRCNATPEPRGATVVASPASCPCSCTDSW